MSIAQARQPIYKTSLNNSNNFDKYLGNMYNILKQNIDWTRKNKTTTTI